MLVKYDNAEPLPPTPLPSVGWDQRPGSQAGHSRERSKSPGKDKGKGKKTHDKGKGRGKGRGKDRRKGKGKGRGKAKGPAKFIKRLILLKPSKDVVAKVGRS